jgi:hypothetical protein
VRQVLHRPKDLCASAVAANPTRPSTTPESCRSWSKSRDWPALPMRSDRLHSCGRTVDLVDACFSYTDGNLVCGQDRATAPYRLVQSGDSGGPVVVNNGGSSASLAGIISGGNESGTVLTFTHINRVVSTMGVAVATY